jgi:hypothetical protein
MVLLFITEVTLTYIYIDKGCSNVRRAKTQTTMQYYA